MNAWYEALMVPALPCDGRIEEYDLTDALGTIRLDGGETLRFGRTACSFDPRIGVRVRVISASTSGPGHPRASRVDPLDADPALRESERVVLLRTILLRPVEHCSSWSLACVLAGSHAPRADQALGEIRLELRDVRGKSEDEIDAMVALVRWAIDALNPPDSRSAHTVVGDFDDLRLAIDTARGRIGAAEADRLQSLIDRHVNGSCSSGA